MEIDEPLRFSERRVTPRLGLRITERRDWNGTHFEAVLLFDYGRGYVEEEAASRGLWSAEERVYTVRDAEAEDQARNTLLAAGLRPEGFAQSWRFVPRLLPRVVRELVQAGWHVEADGKAFRQPGKSRVEVSSGIDWFDLYAEVDYGGVSASLPQLLGALRRGETMVRLGDGSFGLLPEEWLARFAPLAGLGTGEHGEDQSALPHQPGRIAGCAAGGAAGSPGGRSLRARARAPAQFRRRPRRRPAGGFRGRAARLPARGPGLDGVSARIRIRRLPGRRYGGGQDGAGAGAAGGPAHPVPRGRRWWWRRNRSCSTGARRPPASPRSCACWNTPARTADPEQFRRIRPGSHHLWHRSCGTPPALSEIRIRLRGAGRGAGHQERRHRFRQSRAPAARAGIAWRSAARPSKTTWASCGACSNFSIPACWARPGCCKMSGGLARNPERGIAPPAGPCAAPVHPAPHQAAGGAGAAGENRADDALRARSRTSASNTRTCAGTIATACWSG